MSTIMFNNICEFYFDRIDSKSPFDSEFIQKKYGIINNFVITENEELPEEIKNLKTSLKNINSVNISSIVKSIVFLDITNIKNINILRYLHKIYSIYICLYNHYCISDNDKIIIPYNLSIPILFLCRQLSMAPYITYSDIILNNIKLSTINNKKNMEIDFTFTKLPIEKKYYTILLKIELNGSHMLKNIFNILKNVSEGMNCEIEFKNISQYLKEYISWIVKFNNDERIELKKVLEYYKKDNFFHYFGEKYVIEELESPYVFYNMSISQSPLIQTLNVFFAKNSIHIKNNRLYCYKEHQQFISEFEKFFEINKISDYLNTNWKIYYNEAQLLFDNFLSEILSLYLL